MGVVKNGEAETNRHESFWEGLVNRMAERYLQKQNRSVLNVELKTRLVPLGVRVVEEKEAEVEDAAKDVPHLRRIGNKVDELPSRRLLEKMTNRFADSTIALEDAIAVMAASSNM